MWIVTKDNKRVAEFFMESDAKKYANKHKGCRADYVSF